MKLTISINMDNAAFEYCDGRGEAARILAVIARKLEQGTDRAADVYDINGNNVGCWKIIGKQPIEREDDRHARSGGRYEVNP